MNRQITGRITTYHFAPTQLSRQNLSKENVNESAIIVTGNTVIDALYMVVDKIKNNADIRQNLDSQLFDAGYDVRRLKYDKPLVLITGHRRENFGEGFINICKAIKTLAEKYPNVDFIYPMHLNPNVRRPILEVFGKIINHDLDIQINDPNVLMKLVYVDDVVASFMDELKNGKSRIAENGHFETVLPVHEMKLGEIVDLIRSFKESRNTLQIPNLGDAFTKKLYSTYLSYLPDDEFSYLLKMNVDQRGSFTEFLKSPERGQVSINISKSGITKGQHWHHTKNEKFLVVSGRGVIRFRKIGSDEIIEYHARRYRQGYC